MKLREILKKRKKFAIAMSGGVDSTLLAAVAHDVCCDNVIALTASSQFQSVDELQRAADMAAVIGIRHYVIEVDVLSDPDIVSNTRDRCYFCKRKLFGALVKEAEKMGFETLAHGANMDDIKDYRPGLRAAEELKIFSPFVEAEIYKKDIRILSKELGLATWDLPSQSCLATRIPYGEILTSEKLARVEACEQLLIRLGFAGVRVRAHGNIARIEAPADQIEEIAQRKIRDQISSFCKEQGFLFVSLDLSGYVSGSMNAF